MKRLYIIVEGQSEEEFVKELIAPYFQTLGFYDVRGFKIRTSKHGKGGFVNYQHLKKDIERLLKSERNILVTTFVDYFRIPNSLPSYLKCYQQHTATLDRVLCLEKAVALDINDNRFLPYIQLHEFEALLFSSNTGFETYYESAIYEQTKQIIHTYPNPELINEHPATAPSKRLLAIISTYKKVLDGNCIALEIGLETILSKCPRFKNWIILLLKKMTM